MKRLYRFFVSKKGLLDKVLLSISMGCLLWTFVGIGLKLFWAWQVLSFVAALIFLVLGAILYNKPK